ncbi:MAG: phytoene desaturase [Bacteroidetes bacterium]|nr:phytoene desaturase [Bacteroidota bacterium]
MRIIVIGSGFGGLAAAIRLRQQGHDVTLLEKRDRPGGRAYVYEQDGFTFDGGPTVITAPWLINELFERSGRDPGRYVRMVPVEPFYRIYFEDGSTFNYSADREAMIGEVRRFNPDDVEGYLRFLEKTEKIFNTGFGLIDTPFLGIGSMLKVLPDLARLRADKSVYRYVASHVRNEKLRRVFSFHPLLVGGNPFQTTSIYTLILFLEKKWGVWFAMGGTGSIVSAMERLFSEIGGRMVLNAEVREIVMDEASGLACGVRLAGDETLEADAVVCNGDVSFAYMHLLPERYRRSWRDAKLNRLHYSMSLFVLYFGTRCRYNHIPHHSIMLGERYEGLLHDIFRRKHLSDDFSLYLHRPTATDPSLAPAGMDAFYVLSPVPHLGSGDDWHALARPYRDRIVRYLETRYMPDLSNQIVTERSIDPLHFRDTLNSHLGSAFSIAPLLTQSAWFRPHNRSEDVPNLYFVGAGTHPGAGLPGVLSSAKIAADLIGSA